MMGDQRHSEEQPNNQLELWGGVECTVARIGAQFRDQCEETGHSRRDDDLAAIAALGIKTLRYPVIWETVSPVSPDECDWSWHDERLPRFQELGIKPIAGLVHHGSGPLRTNLLDPHFPELLADYAGKVAERYPWITDYTPVNEPLTTARFSALYGHWYPHARDYRSFLRALINQVRGVVLAMRAIRNINPSARLVQTDDLGKTFSTPALEHQADYENERRWLTFDLLCGRIDPSHPFYSEFVANGVGEDELARLVDAPCPPDVVGINHYLTSERYLDEDYARYPRCFWGGNGTHDYADVEAVRMHHLPPAEIGPYARLKEAWERYRLPTAVTEAHHGCSRDEQVRWLLEVWTAATRLRDEGADILAVTIWSILGAVDWNSLLVRSAGFYEPGALDVRSSPPRRTVLFHAAASLATIGGFEHPVLDNSGWWSRDSRFYHPPATKRVHRLRRPPRKLLVTGARGTLGRAFARVCEERGLPYALLSRHDMDISDPSSVEAALDNHRPWAVVNAAGYVRVRDAGREEDRCRRDNVRGAEVLATICSRLGIPFVTFSSDLVFDGRLGRAYVEGDPVSPTCVYGLTKAEAERLVSGAHRDALVIRTSAFFGPWDRHNFVYKTARDLASGRPVAASDTTFVSPTYVPDLVHGSLDLLIDGTSGTWHLANKGSTSWFSFASRIADRAGLEVGALIRTAGERVDTTLSSARGLILPALDSAIDRFFDQIEQRWDAELAEAAE